MKRLPENYKNHFNKEFVSAVEAEEKDGFRVIYYNDSGHVLMVKRGSMGEVGLTRISEGRNQGYNEPQTRRFRLYESELRILGWSALGFPVSD